MVESKAFEILMALSKLEEKEREKASDVATRALQRAQKWGLVAKVADE